MKYYAHSTDGPEDEWQGLAEHLQATARLAAGFAAAFGNQAWGYLVGLLHDIGKYSREFKKRLQGGPRVDHSLAGALEALEHFKKIDSPVLGLLAAHIISGHHTGLVDGLGGSGGGASLKSRLDRADRIPDYSAWKTEITLPPPNFPVLAKPEPGGDPADRQEAFALRLFLWARMIFSCLVDADCLDTEAFMQPEQSALRGGFPHLSELKAAVDAHLRAKTDQAEETAVNRCRAKVLNACREAAELEPGIFSLTVPTGGGKTLSSLAFALDHALKHGLRRIIYVSPYTSIIDQTAAVFREAFGPELAKAVLEHHSGVVENATPPDPDEADDEEDARKARTLAFENWDAPIIVTTAVQFFESLFAAQKSRCRKIHNIAASVVILDEAQTLPRPLFRPCLAVLKELTASYGVSTVLCTATQPEVGVQVWNPNGLTRVREIIKDVPALFQDLERTAIEFIGPLSLPDLAVRLVETRQVLCIVNTRAQARELSQLTNKSGRTVFHLSTWMCPAHRREVLNRVKTLLDDPTKPPLILVSTSLIEAGVDIDFPVVYRALTGLDSIIQAAGRNNRERRLVRGQVFVFELPESLGGEQALRRSLGYAALQKNKSPFSPTAIKTYFAELHSILGLDKLDKYQILTDLAKTVKTGYLPFSSVSNDFRLIETNDQPLIIPFNAEAEEALEILRRGEGDLALHRRLQQWTVNVPERAMSGLARAGVVASVKPKGFKGTGGLYYYELLNPDLYQKGEPDGGPALGLDVQDPAFMKASSLFLG